MHDNITKIERKMAPPSAALPNEPLPNRRKKKNYPKWANVDPFQDIWIFGPSHNMS